MLTVLALAAALASSGCGSTGAKGEYILAEKLWQEQSYVAAAAQFERAFAKDQKGELGKQALYRAATTQYLFNRKYAAALALFRKYLEVEPTGAAARDAEIQIGEILFEKTQQYEAAIEHYRRWLRERPGDERNTEFLYRVGRSQLHLWQFEDAVQTMSQLSEQSGVSPWISEALFQKGMAYLALADQGGGGAAPKQSGKGADDAAESDTTESLSRREYYRRALSAFEQTRTRFPKSKAAQEAGLGVATIYEELGQWQDALTALAPLESTYPVPQVIKIRMIRIRERLARQSPPLKRK